MFNSVGGENVDTQKRSHELSLIRSFDWLNSIRSTSEFTSDSVCNDEIQDRRPLMLKGLSVLVI